MKMLKLASAIIFCLPMVTGCCSYHAKFQYDCNNRQMVISQARPSPLSICVQDNRQIDDKKLLAKYSVGYVHYKVISNQNPSNVIKEAIYKELICQGYTINEESPVRLNIAINEMCTVLLFMWSFDECNNYGAINADISILNKGKTIYSTNIQTTIKSSDDGKGGIDPTCIATPLLYEFTQDVLSDREILNALSTIK